MLSKYSKKTKKLPGRQFLRRLFMSDNYNDRLSRLALIIWRNDPRLLNHSNHNLTILMYYSFASMIADRPNHSSWKISGGMDLTPSAGILGSNPI